MKLSLRQKINIAFVMALIILGLVGFASHRSVTGLVETAQHVGHTHDVVTNLENVLSNIKDAETGQRGYLLTGIESYLEPYRTSTPKIQQSLRSLRSLTADNPSQQHRLDALDPLVASKLTELQETVDLRRDRGFDAAVQVVLTDQGKQLMDHIRQVVGDMENQEYASLRQRQTEANVSAHRSTSIVLFGSIVAFVVIPLAGLLINVEITRRTKIEQALDSRTKELAASEQELRKQTRILQSILDSMGDGVVVADENGKFLVFNSAAKNILGVGATDSKPSEWSDRYGLYLADGVTPHPPDDLPLPRALRGEAVDGAEILVRHPGATADAWIDVTARPLKEDGVFRGGVAVFRDVTINKQAEASLLHAKEEAERASKFKDQFLSTMSHELRTPLNAVLGFSGLLADERYGSLNDRQKRYVNNIHDGGQHLLKLISDILDLSKIEAGRMELAVQDVPIEAAFAEALDALRPLADRKSQTLFQDSIPDLIIRADVTRLKQMLMNLVANAIKFTPEGGRIKLSGTKTDGQIRVDVEDNGPGIPPGEQQRIFQAFYRLRESGEATEGTGLGLAITQRLVELHGGELGLESHVGQGSRFYFSLAAATGVRKPRVLEASKVRAESEGTPTILIVEDDPTAASLIESQLTSSGYETIRCEQSQDAAKFADKLQPDVITLDLLMKPCNGWEVLLELKRNPHTADIPVIVISIVDQPAIGTTLGADEYLIKPVDKAALLAAVRRSLMTNSGIAPLRPILVVEDDTPTREVVAELLTAQGYAVITAAGGEEARAQVAAALPELVILDLVMPKVSGFDLLAEWRATPRTADLPVFVLTSKELNKSEEQYLRQHAESLFHKEQPWQQALTAQLQRVLKKVPASQS